MHDKIVLITGGSSGIGKETTRALAHKGATIVMACRDIAKAGKASDEIKNETGNSNIDIMLLDLASLDSIREFARNFLKKYDRLHVLINNAGVFCMKREETADGFEKSIGVNHLGTFLLTNLLLPIIRKTPGARIVNVASDGHYQAQIDLNDLQFTKNFNSMKVYGASKMAMVIFTLDLAERLKGTGITVNALHPGNVATNMWDLWPNGKWYQVILSKIIHLFLISVEEGARTVIHLASSDDVQNITGKYYSKMKLKDVSPKCKDQKLQKDLWRLSEKLTGIA